ncbi:MAG: EAL domain-containing protein [Actinomycetota bacterium]|nr:EAL domain-containing protein [Actinomycetota bacterium]
MALAGSIRMLFQPIVDLQDGHVVGHEALARGPGGSVLEAPAELFREAALAGRTAELDWACRAEAFRCSLSSPRDEGWRLFVNAEPSALNTACPAPLIDAWRRAHRELNIVVEVTERFLMRRPADVVRVVGTLRDLGWEIALDDTGANDATVALLPVLTPDIVKLDRLLLKRSLTPHALSTLKAVTTYCERSGAALLVEGVETESDLARARELGARWAQGFLLGRPSELPTYGAEGRAARAATGRARPRQHHASWDPRVDDLFRQHAKPDVTLLVESAWLLERLQGVGQQAASQPTAGVLLLFVGVGIPLSESFLSLLDRLHDVCAVVALEAVEPPGPRKSGLRISPTARPAAVHDQVAAAYVSPSFSCGLVGRRTDDGRYEVALLTAPDDLSALARALLSRVPPSP